MHKFTSPTATLPEASSIAAPATAKPFLKWAGGKTQLLPYLHRYLPPNFNQYLEPFLGGGALFFNLRPQKAILSDANEELVITYHQVQTNVSAVIKHLKTFKGTSAFYYQMRQMLPAPLPPALRAARLIYLNKTCFNGLYRVNKKGQFNVPYGKGSGQFLDETTLRQANKALQAVRILAGDYLTVLTQHAQAGDFIFLDPPYYPVGKHADFKRYTPASFYHDDHVKLKETFTQLVNKGCHVLLTNSDHQTILELYEAYEIKVIDTRRAINCHPHSRTGKDIIVIGHHD